jgi:hypothetical protein
LQDWQFLCFSFEENSEKNSKTIIKNPNIWKLAL